MIRSFLALYRGEDIEHSELIAVSGDQRLIRGFVRGLVEGTEEEPAPRRGPGALGRGDGYPRRPQTNTD